MWGKRPIKGVEAYMAIRNRLWLTIMLGDPTT